MRNERLNHFRAWCSGTAYQLPNKAIRYDAIRGIRILIDDCPLGNFYFKTNQEYSKAKRILRYYMNKSTVHPS